MLAEGEAVCTKEEPRTQRVVEAHQLEPRGEPVSLPKVCDGIAVELEINGWPSMAAEDPDQHDHVAADPAAFARSRGPAIGRRSGRRRRRGGRDRARGCRLWRDRSRRLVVGRRGGRVRRLEGGRRRERIAVRQHTSRHRRRRGRSWHGRATHDRRARLLTPSKKAEHHGDHDDPGDDARRARQQPPASTGQLHAPPTVVSLIAARARSPAHSVRRSEAGPGSRPLQR